MKKSLFIDGEKYSEDAFSLDKDVMAAMKPIMRKYREMGYSARQISHVINLAVYDLEIEVVL